MLSLPRFGFDDDDDYMLFPRDLLLWPRRLNSQCQRVNNMPQYGVPFTANNHFNLNLDLHHFEPNDISVKMDGGMVKVNAKYENNDNGHHVFREYSHKFSVPDTVIADQMKCKMTPRGVLQIDAPLKEPEPTKGEGRQIPIEFVSRPQIKK